MLHPIFQEILKPYDPNSAEQQALNRLRCAHCMADLIELLTHIDALDRAFDTWNHAPEEMKFDCLVEVAQQLGRVTGHAYIARCKFGLEAGHANPDRARHETGNAAPSSSL